MSEPKADALTQPPSDGALMASYSVFVVEPGTLPGKRDDCFTEYPLNVDKVTHKADLAIVFILYGSASYVANV